MSRLSPKSVKWKPSNWISEAPLSSQDWGRLSQIIGSQIWAWSESNRGSVQLDCWAPSPEFLVEQIWLRPENLHSYMFPGVTDGLWTILREPLLWSHSNPMQESSRDLYSPTDGTGTLIPCIKVFGLAGTFIVISFREDMHSSNWYRPSILSPGCFTQLYEKVPNSIWLFDPHHGSLLQSPRHSP